MGRILNGTAEVEMPLNPFDSPRVKIRRAEQHLNELEIKVREFKSKRPYEIVIEPDVRPGYKVYKLRLTEPVPYRDLSPVVGDIVNNIRAALDHIVYACALANGHASPRYKTCSFPFGRTRIDFNNAVDGCTSVPPEIRTCLRKFNAYDGGHDALWELNNMCNRDKHALVTPVVCGYRDISVRSESGRIEPPANVHWDRTKDEVELFRSDSDAKYDLAATIDIALDNAGVLTLFPVVPMLDSLFAMTESIIMTIEGEARRIGLTT